MDLNLNKVCRLCARKCEDMQNIFQDTSSEPEIYMDVTKDLSGMLPLKIATVTSIKVELGDGLPTQVCNECVAHLNAALTFKEKCLTADSILRHLLNSVQEAQGSKELNDEKTAAADTSHMYCNDRNTSHDDEKAWEDDVYTETMKNGTSSDMPQSAAKDGSDVEAVNAPNEEKQYTCPPCGKRYLLSAAFKKHLSMKHEMDDRSIEELIVKCSGVSNTSKPINKKTCLCNICGKQVSSVQFKQHIRSHEQNFQHLCTYCGKKYLTKFRLTQHIRVHTGEKPFACNVCNKRFHEKSLLRSHQRRYLQQRPLQCTVCEKRFTNRSHLNTHLMVHTGEKPFQCLVCGMEFRSNNHLKRHFKLHSGEKSYTCGVCGKAFIQKSNYVQHLAVHREDKPFKCSECGKGFSYKCSLKMHMEVHRKKLGELVEQK
ncbi:zinc finger protein OZF-like [Zootermopsis nevadensis]|uniref:Zinc finger and SCAN domain-containing protein 22 n=1 Tax=Zootermopsis nevadensis TaxID=136037 RepID=A0A067QPK4_ZOONE|nr:zinc finger protein OZF-like [Zootermopsis nevadensis]XP_021941924.1 zinc finger protein OZF-like [Zootermopsis nevadensis]KDQ84116.1 Zinc finger and SCAN domain-containing protein 22 [Zootermopsis nevadensis]